MRILGFSKYHPAVPRCSSSTESERASSTLTHRPQVLWFLLHRWWDAAGVMRSWTTLNFSFLYQVGGSSFICILPQQQRGEYPLGLKEDQSPIETVVQLLTVSNSATPWSAAGQACTQVHVHWVSDADRREPLNSPGQLGPQSWEPLSTEPAPETLRWRRKVLQGAPRGPSSAQRAGLPSQGSPGVQGKRLLHASSLSLSPATESSELVSLESQFINFFVYSEGKKREVHFYRWPWPEVFDEEASRVKGSPWFIYVLIKWRHPSSYIFFFHISLMDVLLEINYTQTHSHTHTHTHTCS